MYQSKWAPQPEEESSKTPALPAEEPRRPTTSSSLSAAAPTFSPAPLSPSLAAPPPDVSTIDTFAQTGAGQDDLFDDVIPVDESMRVRSDDDLFSDDFTPVPQPVVEQPAFHAPPSRGRGDGHRGRGRGRGRGGSGSNGHGGRSGALQQPNTAAVDNQSHQQAPAPTQDIAPSEASYEATPTASVPPTTTSATSNPPPTAPRKDSTPSVRGDRHATGGLIKPKLTESELAEKMARISLKNASLTAAHARAEADAASFAQREEQVKHVSAQRQRAERKDRQQMMGEREKNRARKLKAMEGREWDAEKNEQDFEGGSSKFDKKGNFAGDQAGWSDGREYLLREGRDGGRRGGGRGAAQGTSKARPAAVPKEEDFPALDGSAHNGKTESAAAIASPVGGTGDAKASWADQVESSNA